MGFFSDTKNRKKKNKKRKGITSPSVFCIIFFLMFLVIGISWILYWVNGADPYGKFHPAGILELFTAPIKGFVNSGEIIIFLFMISAFLRIVNKSKALDAGIGTIFLKLKGKELTLIIILFFTFMLCGTTFGMCEATIPFYFLLIPILLAAGFDSYTALLVITFGAGIGVLASTINPMVYNNAFNAVNKSLPAEWGELSTSTGMVWRIVSLVVLASFTLGYMLFYTHRIRKNPQKSIMYDLREAHKEKFHFDVKKIPELTTKRKWIIVCFATTFILLIVGAIPWDTITGLNGFELLGKYLAEWFPYIAGQSYDPVTHQVVSNIADVGSWSVFEMAFLFFIATFIVALINWQGEKEFGNDIVQGAADFAGVALIVAIANGFSVLLAETGIRDVLIDSVSTLATTLHPTLFALILFILFFIISIFIPSMSGFANAVFPTVGPALSGGIDALNGTGMTVSGSVLGFSMANGLVNLTMPTAGPFVICLQICDISLSRFYKSSYILVGGITLLSALLLMIGTLIPGGNIF